MAKRAVFYVSLLLASGCAMPADPEPPVENVGEVGTAFDPSDCGDVAGQVVWVGPRPSAPPYYAPPSPRLQGLVWKRSWWANARAPLIGPEGGVANGVVMLRGVDPRRGRPWDHPSVRVEVRDHRLTVLQGKARSLYGFVQRGRNVEVASEQDAFQSIQFRGDAFFTLPLPDAGVVHRRRLDRAGVVELSSASGSFWMASWLFVSDHPYLARTDAKGHFVLPQVPAGTYQLVCWLPNWNEVRRELDGDSWEVSSITYAPALTVERTIHVEAGRQVAVKATFHAP